MGDTERALPPLPRCVRVPPSLFLCRGGDSFRSVCGRLPLTQPFAPVKVTARQRMRAAMRALIGALAERSRTAPGEWRRDAAFTERLLFFSSRHFTARSSSFVPFFRSYHAASRRVAPSTIFCTVKCEWTEHAFATWNSRKREREKMRRNRDCGICRWKERTFL